MFLVLPDAVLSDDLVYPLGRNAPGFKRVKEDPMRPTLFVGMLLAAIASSAVLATPVKAASDELTQIKSRGVISVADCLSFKPFGFYNASGAPVGYDIDLAKALATSLGVKLHVVNVTSDNRIPYLQTGKVDVVFCNFTITPQRAQAIDFTIPYVISGEGVIANKNSKIETIKDLAGKKIAVTKGSTNAQLVGKAVPNAQVMPFNDDTSAIAAVKSGQADAFIEDLNFLTYQAGTNPNLRVLHATIGEKEYNGWGVRKGHPKLLAYLNDFIRKVTADGLSHELFEKWFKAAPIYPLHYTPNSTDGLDLVKAAESGAD